MLRSFLAAITLFAASAAIAAPPPSKGKAGKSTICHIPPGNPSAAHTLTVAPPAVQAHLDHGDRVGSCSDGTTIVDDSPQAAAADTGQKKRKKRRKKKRGAQKKR